MDEKEINKILANAKKNMEIEGFSIPQELENTGRKILSGELEIEDYIEICKQKAQNFSYKTGNTM